jgi:ribosomal protein S18 acetylase RimI-like enzyme
MSHLTGGELHFRPRPIRLGQENMARKNRDARNPLRGHQWVAKVVSMKLSVWVQFTWNLKTLPAETPKLNSRYTAEAATLDDRPLLLAAVTRSMSMEPAWSDDLASRVKLADEIVQTAFPAGEVTFVAIKHGTRIIGASAIRDSGDRVSNLPLGVCVLNEYRCRGLGTYLLHESLRRLKDRGLEEAHLVTRKGLTADRFLYPKFGGQRAVLAGVPA